LRWVRFSVRFLANRLISTTSRLRPREKWIVCFCEFRTSNCTALASRAVPIVVVQAEHFDIMGGFCRAQGAAEHAGRQRVRIVNASKPSIGGSLT
jgi:hypothetical protein